MKKLIPLMLTSLFAIFPVVGFGMEQITFDLRPRMSYQDKNGKRTTEFIEVKGVYAKIDVSKSQNALEIFALGSNQEKKAIADQMERNLGDYNPAALLGLAAYYYKHDNTNRSALISTLAHIRMAIDLACSTQDQSVTGVYDLMEYDFITKLGFRNGFRVEARRKEFFQVEKNHIEQAITLDKQLGRSYDRRWMYLLGMNAIVYSLHQQEDLNNNIEPHSIAMLEGKQEQEIIEKIHAGESAIK